MRIQDVMSTWEYLGRGPTLGASPKIRSYHLLQKSNGKVMVERQERNLLNVATLRRPEIKHLSPTFGVLT
jgi:hypothetical protein